MKKNSRLEARRKKISKDVEEFVQQSFDIVDRIHEILSKQGKEQKDLAKALGKTESEISKWMSGTHNFTIKTITKIEHVLGERILQVTKAKTDEKKVIVMLTSPNYIMKKSGQTSQIPNSFGTQVHIPTQNNSSYLN